MNLTPKKYISDFARFYPDHDFQLKLYGIWFLLTAVFIGFFGIKPLIPIIKQKASLVTEMKNVKVQLDDNAIKLKSTSQLIFAGKQYINNLDAYMPTKPDVQTYILELIGAIGKHNYVVRNITQNELTADPGTISIRVQTEGATYPTELVTEIEKLKRITNVDEVTFSSQLLSTRVLYKATFGLQIYRQTL